MTSARFPLLNIPKKHQNHIYTTELPGTYTDTSDNGHTGTSDNGHTDMSDNGHTDTSDNRRMAFRKS